MPSTAVCPESAGLQAAIDYAKAHEVAWSRDNSDPWGVHGADPAPSPNNQTRALVRAVPSKSAVAGPGASGRGHLRLV